VIALLSFTFAAAAAETGDDASWWIGLPLSDVQLASPGGSLPPESLEALLRTQQAADRGEPLDPHLLRLDLVTLFQVGEFSSVEADVEPWVTTGEDGELERAVLLTFVVRPAPRIDKIKVEGNERFRRAAIEDLLGVATGQTFYADTDAARAAARVEQALNAKGYPDAIAEVTATTTEAGTVEVTVVVQEGEPRIVDRLVIAGDLEGVVPPRKLRRWARPDQNQPATGIAPGRPLAPDAIEAAKADISAHLGKMRRPFPLPVRRAWIEARVTPLVTAVEGTTNHVKVTMTVEPGPELDVLVTDKGKERNRRRFVIDALDIDQRTRLTRGFVERAPERIRSALQDKGWLQADVTVVLEESDEHHARLVVQWALGQRHLLRHRAFLGIPFNHKVEFAFLEKEMSPKERRQLWRHLEIVLDQASTDFLRRRTYTPAEMDRALGAARLFLVDQGYLDARLELSEPTFIDRKRPINLFKTKRSRGPRIEVVPNVTVERGPITRLSVLEVISAAEDVPLPDLEAARRDLVGDRFSPQRLDALAARLVEAHKNAGYLQADAKVVQLEEEAGARVARIEMFPGPQVVLRSTVVRNARHTRTSFVQNVVDDTVTLGQPITAPQLDEVRRDLYDLGTFRLVSLQLIGEEYEPARDLVIDLTERARYEFELAPGVSTDEGIRLFGRATRHNVFGLAHRIDVIGQVGFDWLSKDVSNWVPDFTSPEWRLAVTYTAPRFPIPSQELVADVVLREVEQERSWEMDRSGAGLGVETKAGRCPDAPCTRFRLGTRVELRRFAEIDQAVLLEGEPWTVLIGPGEAELPTLWRVQDSVTGLVVTDLRDDPISPHTGWLLSLNAEWAPGLPWNENDQPRTAFVKGEARFSGYVPIQRVVLHLGLGGGKMWSLRQGDAGGVVPVEDRFRLGGTGSFRGFVRDGVGPHNSADRVDVAYPAGIGPVVEYTLRDDPRRWAPTGGDTTASGTVQLVVPLTALGMAGWDNYSGSLFVDAGNVWFLDPSATPTTDIPRIADLIPDLRVGLGAGVQALTPVGPLSLDFAVNPQAALATGAQRVQLVEELEEPNFRVHLTLGATL
jgi:outer membrane protein assembly factor BamA